ncbi:hypothetical protein D3C86_1803240 [compost metagenome]
MLQALAQVLVEIVELAHIQMTARHAPVAAAQRGDGRQHHQDGHHQGHGPGQKACVLGKKLHLNPPCLAYWRLPSGGTDNAQA